MLLATAAFAQTSFLSNDDRVLVTGKPSLRQSDVNKAIEVFEFYFGGRFSDKQREEYQGYLEIAWREKEKQTIEDTLAIAALHPGITRANEAQRAKLRESLPQLVQILEANRATLIYSHLLNVYNDIKYQGETQTADKQREEEPQRRQPNAVENRFNSTGAVKDLVGKWEKKTSGMSSYSGSKYLGSSGNYESYTFHADGRVEYTMLIAVQNYGCRLEAFSQSNGSVNLSGPEITINLNAGTIRRDDSCSSHKNYTKSTHATSMKYGWKVRKDEYGTVQLCLTEPNGQTFCYRRAKE